MTRAWLLPALVAGGVLLPAAAAHGSFPGSNGRIAFDSERDGNAEIYTVNPDGSELVRVTTHEAEDRDPGWSGDGRRLAFTSLRDGNAEIYVANADGSDPRRLTFHPAVDADPAWSPDGTMIAFTSLRDDNLEIYVMSADGSAPRRLTADLAADQQAAWSPDGSTLAFESARGGDLDIYTMSASDGSAVANVTRDPALDADANWAPNGTRIAFTSDRGTGRAIYSTGTDGATSGAIPVSSSAPNFPAFSPDGTQIAYGAPGPQVGLQLLGEGSSAARFMASARDPDWGPLPAPDAADPPEPAATADVAPARGRVKVMVKGATKFVNLVAAAEVPVGSTFDTRFGAVSLTTAAARDGAATQSVDLSGGVFSIAQRGRAELVTEVRLPRLRRCPRPQAIRGGSEARHRRRSRRRNRVRGRGRGFYRTRAGYSNLTVNATTWEVIDRCHGTLSRVIEGRATVRDLVRRRDIVLDAGERYFARTPHP